MEIVGRNIFENIFWPASAGSVLWAFCSVVIESAKFDVLPSPTLAIAICLKLMVLIIIAVYLTIGWLQFKTAPKGLKGAFWFFEPLHLFTLTMSAAAISATGSPTRPGVVEYWLMAYFLVTIAGHAANAWKFWDDEDYQRWKLILANVLGLVVITIGYQSHWDRELSSSLSFVTAFFLWVTIASPRLQPIADRLARGAD